MKWERYESPIKVIHATENMIGEIQMEMDKAVMRAVQKVGIIVDKEELQKALDHDRDSYEMGYLDGLEAGKEEAFNIIRTAVLPMTEVK